MHVPTIDISAWYGDDEAAKAELCASMDDVATNVGFLKISGHHVPADLITAMEEVTTAFFDLPLEVKMGFQSDAPEVNRGYAPMGSEALSYSVGVETPPDLFEAFNVGLKKHEIDLDQVKPEHHVLYVENVWPDRPPTMQQTWETYIDAVYDLAQDVLDMLAASLDLEPGFFSSKAIQAPDVLRCLNYERADGAAPPLPGQMRLGAHSDYGMVTILHADPVPGLQLLDSDDTWVDVLPTPGTFLVNIGDMLAAWTNDRWRSTLHRVVPPTSESGPARRRSYAFFHEAETTAMIEPLASCVDDDHPLRYETISAGDHLYGKIVSPRSMSVTTSVSTAGDRVDKILS